MNPGDLELSGGESVYCINESQLSRARRMAGEGGRDNPLRAELERLASRYSRNERAALAFLLIDSLVKEPADR
jgi:hypothetical protein